MSIADGSELFTGQFQTRIVAQLYRDPRFLKAVGTFLRPEQFSAVFGGHYLKDAVIWAKHWSDTYPSQGVIPRFVFDQWVKQWIDAQPQSNRHEYHRQAWARMGYELFEEPDAGGKYVQDQTIEWVKRQEEQICLAQAKVALDGGKSLVELDLLSQIRDIDALTASVEDIGIMLGFDPADEYHGVLHVPPRRVIPLGYSQLDKVCSGGMGRKELWVPAAPPNTGKTTTLAAWAARWIMRGNFVVYYSLEQAAEQIRDKIIGSMSNVLPDVLRANPPYLHAWLQHLHAGGGRLVIQEYPSGKATVDHLYAHLNVLHGMVGRYPDVVLIDYADNMNLGSQYKEIRHALSRIYVNLRGMAQEMDLLCVTPTQTNRGSVKKEIITIEDVAEDFQKAAIADGIIALCQMDHEVDDGLVRLFLAKNRHGPKYVTIPYRINPQLAALEEQERKAAMTHGFDMAGSSAQARLYQQHAGYAGMAQNPVQQFAYAG